MALVSVKIGLQLSSHLISHMLANVRQALSGAAKHIKSIATYLINRIVGFMAGLKLPSN